MRGKEGRRTNDDADIRVVDLQPHFKTIRVFLIETIKIFWMITNLFNTHDIYDKTDTRVADRRP